MELKFTKHETRFSTKIVTINNKQFRLNELLKLLNDINNDNVVVPEDPGLLLKEIGVLKSLGFSSLFWGAQKGPNFKELLDRLVYESTIEYCDPPEFFGFGKISRLSRECIITEKIDGTNGQIYIVPMTEADVDFHLNNNVPVVYYQDGFAMMVGSKNRWITPSDDNHGFANWTIGHREELILDLGPGRHFGEWWGQGINRNYGLKEKRFSLFNVQRWCLHGETPKEIPTEDPRIMKTQKVLPPCCGLVPVLYQGIFKTSHVDECLEFLTKYGSAAVPGFMKPEGVVIYHIQANVGFKKTIEGDEFPKGKVKV